MNHICKLHIMFLIIATTFPSRWDKFCWTDDHLTTLEMLSQTWVLDHACWKSKSCCYLQPQLWMYYAALWFVMLCVFSHCIVRTIEIFKMDCLGKEFNLEMLSLVDSKWSLQCARAQVHTYLTICYQNIVSRLLKWNLGE